MNKILHLDIIQYILDMLTISDKLKFKTVCKSFYINLQVINIKLTNALIDNKGLTDLDISDFERSTKFDKYGQFEKVNKLKICYGSIYVNELIKLPNLETLHITPWNCTDFEDLSPTLYPCYINRSINSLTQLTNLKELIVENNMFVKDFNRFTQLKTLELHGCHNVNYEGLDKLVNINILKTLY